MRLFEAKKLEDDVRLSNAASETIMEILFMVSQTHLWHWQTKQYAAHEALGNYYENLQQNVDKLAELFMGAGGKLQRTKSRELTPFSDKNSTITILKDFRFDLNELQAELMEKENSAFHSIGDTLLDIVKDTDQLLYLLSLE